MDRHDRHLRPLQPAGPVERPLYLGPIPSLANKRTHIQVACYPCRKRKSKCDGEKPKCLLCRVKNTPCEYAESRRPSNHEAQQQNDVMREHLYEVQQSLHSLESVFEYLQVCPEVEAQEALRRIRGSNADGQKLTIYEVIEELEKIHPLFKDYLITPAAEDDEAEAMSAAESSSQPPDSIPEGELPQPQQLQMQMPPQQQIGTYAGNIQDPGISWMHGDQVMSGLASMGANSQYPMYSFSMPQAHTQRPIMDIHGGAAGHLQRQQEDDDLDNQG